jgi:probable phosphoglycerate mutase
VPLFVFARHGHTTYNVEHRVNGDPSVPVALSEDGRVQARALGLMIAHHDWDLCVHTRFPRTVETARLALGDRFDRVPQLEEPGLDDVDVGELEGWALDRYRAWKEQHTRHDHFPGGESLDDTARRYAQAFRNLAGRPERTVLVVCHDIPVRYLLNAAARSSELDYPNHAIPNATPFLFSRDALEMAAEQIDRIVDATFVHRLSTTAD